MYMKMILATASNGELGLNGELPWPFNRYDMEHYIKELNTCGVVVMGRKTWETLPSKLTNKIKVVVSNSTIKELEKEGTYPDYVLNGTIEYMMDTLNYICEFYSVNKIANIGGKEIYNLFKDYADEIVHSHILGTYNADTYLNIKDLTDKQYTIQSSSKHKKDNNLTITYYTRNTH